MAYFFIQKKTYLTHYTYLTYNKVVTNFELEGK